MAPSTGDTINRYHELVAAYNDHDVDRGVAAYHDHAVVVDHGQNQTLSGRDHSRTGYWQDYFEASSDQRLEDLEVLAAGDWTIARGVISGTHDGRWGDLAPTGRRFQVGVCDLVRWDDGRIVEEHLYYDQATILTQLEGPAVLDAAERNRRTMRRFYDAFTPQGRPEDLEGILAERFVSHAIPAELGSGDDPDARRSFIQIHRDAFPDLHIEVLDVVADDSMVAVRARMTGTHRADFLGIPASGNAFEVEFADIARFNGRGELVEIFNHADRLTLLQQLGAIPEPATG